MNQNTSAFRVHDVYSNRILQVLASMQKVSLQALPTDDPWTVEEFLDHTEDICRHAAMVGCIFQHMMALQRNCITVYYVCYVVWRVA